MLFQLNQSNICLRLLLLLKTKTMKLAPKTARNLMFGSCLLTGLIAGVIYAETRGVTVKTTETIVEPVALKNQSTPVPSVTPVAVFQGTINDYTPAERKAMIEAQTQARKEVEADAKAIANGTYREPKPIANNEYKKPVRTRPITWEEIEETNEIILKMQDARTLEEYKEALAELNAYRDRISVE